MEALILPGYFPSISQFAAMAQADKIVWETEDHFQKQTNRNRMYIHSPNGTQVLNVPVKHSRFGHQKTRDVRLEDAFDWQKQHFKSLEAAYRSSPFFEFFEDELLPVFQRKHDFLIDLQFLSIEIALKCLRMQPICSKTDEYFHEPLQRDFRHLINSKKDAVVLEPYTQVFEAKNGFLNNLSILDLLFNNGRFAHEYLLRQTLV